MVKMLGQQGRLHTLGGLTTYRPVSTPIDMLNLLPVTVTGLGIAAHVRSNPRGGEAEQSSSEVKCTLNNCRKGRIK